MTEPGNTPPPCRGVAPRAAARPASPFSRLWWGWLLWQRRLWRGALVLGLLTAVVVAAPRVACAEPPATPMQREVERLVREAARQKLAERPMWWRLLHYRGGLFGVT